METTPRLSFSNSSRDESFSLSNVWSIYWDQYWSTSKEIFFLLKNRRISMRCVPLPLLLLRKGFSSDWYIGGVCAGRRIFFAGARTCVQMLEMEKLSILSGSLGIWFWVIFFGVFVWVLTFWFWVGFSCDLWCRKFLDIEMFDISMLRLNMYQRWWIQF